MPSTPANQVLAGPASGSAATAAARALVNADLPANPAFTSVATSTISSSGALTITPGGSDATIDVTSSDQIDIYLNAPTYNAIHANGPLYLEPTTGMEVYQGGNAMFWFPSGGVATGGASDPGSLGSLAIGGSLKVTGPQTLLPQSSAPATPASGVALWVSTSDGKLHAKDATGTDHPLW